MEPSRRATERLHEARVRVRQAIVRDPLFWLSLLILIFAAVRALNGDITKIYDSALRKWVLDGPSCPLLPGHVNGKGFLPFAVVVSLAVLLQGCRHALGKSARIALTFLLALLGGLAAVVWGLAAWNGHAQILQLSGCCDGIWGLTAASDNLVSSPGHAFGICFLCSIIAAAGLFECKWNKLLLLFAFAIGTTATGLFYFATPLVLVVYLALGLVALVGCAAYLGLQFGNAIVLRFLALILIASLVPVLLAICILPKEMTSFHGSVFSQLSSFPGCLFPDGFAARRAELSASAETFWKESPWLGRGLGSFPLELWLSGAAAKGSSSLGPLNGWWGLLAERGLLGLLTLLLPVAFMLVTFVWRLIGARGRHVFLPLVVLGVTVALVSLGLAFVDGSFLRADSLPLSGVLFALAASSFPARKKRTEDEESAS